MNHIKIYFLTMFETEVTIDVLQQIVSNERGSPILLPYDTRIDIVRDMTERQQEEIEKRRSQLNPLDNMQFKICEIMELDIFKFVFAKFKNPFQILLYQTLKK